MAGKDHADQNPWNDIQSQNIGYVVEQFERFTEHPDSIDPQLRNLFEKWGPPPAHLLQTQTMSTTGNVNNEGYQKMLAVQRLAENIRTYGHLAARVNPLQEPEEFQFLQLDTYGLNEKELQHLPPDIIWPTPSHNITSARDAIERLKNTYTHTIGFEFSHVHDVGERNWLSQEVENDQHLVPLNTEQKKALLYRLTQVEGFEHFLQRTFPGQKRFSIEGIDMLVPILDAIIKYNVRAGTKDIMIGMAHRGRLNVLAHVLGKPYEHIFSEFHHAPHKELVPSEGSMGINFGWTGDVKYHLGAERELEDDAIDTVSTHLDGHITLAHNPSHLEFVNPVVQGYTRAAQEVCEQPGFPKQDKNKALAILVHGDAAFPGEGVVAESLNLSRLRGFHTGGTIHVIANNNLGFTTESTDSRSTTYASDLAKGFEIPIIHVNADDPEACLSAVALASKYRTRFNKDILIDLIGYRRFGHNEMDDPSVTQGLLYRKINNHPTVRERYEKQLISNKIISQDEAQEMNKSVQQTLGEAHETLNTAHHQKQEDQSNGTNSEMAAQTSGHPGSSSQEQIVEDVKPLALQNVQTGVQLTTLQDVLDGLFHWPEQLNVYPKLKKILERRRNALDDNGKVDWALAEALAFGSILKDGTPIRLTGQDSERGTFAQRHLILHDDARHDSFSPLHTHPLAKASFAIYNSPLSEASVLGFEYGYNVQNPQVLTIWEAQYGDFANAGQVIIDQFISAGRAKWGQMSSLVLLLPHGYEGQGPEHSNARLERFLQLSAEHNWIVAYPTSAAQYFHLLRRQAALLTEYQARPLVIMTPKSLLRHKQTASPPVSFSEGGFHPVFEPDEYGGRDEDVERLILCSGKIAVDLQAELEQRTQTDTPRLHIVRIEELYPFPVERVRQLIERYAHVKEIIWLQEEPQNMGAWTFVAPHIRSIVPSSVNVRYVGRPARSSPAEGVPLMHQEQQQRIIQEALDVQ
ncbi:2-oxoglutarate dehydrogenase E1 component [Caldalkalibacillus salinus]|uniref:2-oxoglutarate dehydrogenase E1 component n=1 Tax=Caldalkalibacillus salinus TaxID=2803787 RepID=UPI0019217F7F|nr:2-oxoglutarate dehydrogenase E1 component [Caldalkalibacillus salinus]